MRVPSILLLLLAGLGSMQGHAQTYAERLGWPEGTRALILHVDDAGLHLTLTAEWRDYRWPPSPTWLPRCRRA